MADSLDYKDYFCAFIDVLGFRQMVKGNSAVSNIIPYFDLSEAIRSGWSNTGNKAEIKSFVFSDSIFLAVQIPNLPEAKPQLLRDFLIAAGQLQVHLAKNNIWIRGAVSFGKLYCKEPRNIVFGPALVQAYDLEQKHAKYPRIIVDPQIVGEFGSILNNEFIKLINTPPENVQTTWKGCVLEEWFEGRYEKGSFHRDVPFQIDFLSQFLCPNADFGNPLTTLCENMARKARENLEAYEKIKWVADYLIMRAIKEEVSLDETQAKLIESI